MPITILDYVQSVIGHKGQYPAEDFYQCGVYMLGGCENCQATIGPWNAYPSTSGYWRCGDCIGDTGYPAIGAFTHAVMRDYQCPGCGQPGHLTDVTGRTAFSLSCRHCGMSWTRPF